jgi:hypothetical protein
MNETTGNEGGGGGAAAAPAPSPAPAPAPAPASSVLGTAAAPAPTLAERIPEKYRVLKEDGSLDVEASTTKLAGGYGELAKRFGSGDVAPASPADYKVTIPDAMKESLKDWNQTEDTELQAALGDFHKLGMNQAQVDGVMARYFALAPRLAQAAAILTPEQQADKATTDLKAVWKDDAAFNANLGHAYRAAAQFGAKVGLSMDDIDAAGLGNNPAFMRIMAAIGPELGEDTSIEGNETATADWEGQVRQLRAEKEALKERDPRRQDIQAKINALYEKRYPSRQPA